ncbi:unnamed protein product [Protopolystoma xenopodis]|uniref:Uncharacterized protein n=1 Tax=Protopolystoma xenopodis TaxID=117903 RepID=A0A448WGQ2_9PLAT|nr:unnamed protein product [Protopolystoma xenopodis]
MRLRNHDTKGTLPVSLDNGVPCPLRLMVDGAYLRLPLSNGYEGYRRTIRARAFLAVCQRTVRKFDAFPTKGDRDAWPAAISTDQPSLLRKPVTVLHVRPHSGRRRRSLKH